MPDTNTHIHFINFSISMTCISVTFISMRLESNMLFSSPIKRNCNDIAVGICSLLDVTCVGRRLYLQDHSHGKTSE